MPIISEILTFLPSIGTEHSISKSIVSTTKVGIELEMEGVSQRSYEEHRASGWGFIPDGSLRESGIEAVLKKPLGGVKLVKALEHFTTWRKDHAPGAEVNDRTGMHVHVDVRDLTPRQLKTFLLTSIMFEEVFIEATGGRRDNVFCCRFATSDNQLMFVSKVGMLNRNNVETTFQGTEKYATVNMKSIYNLGSVEFRYHKGTLETDEILSWVNTLLQMKEYSKANEIIPEEMPAVYSACGGKEFFTQVLGEDIASKYYDIPDLEEKLLTGMRLAQDAILLFQLREQQDNIHYTLSKDNYKNPLIDVYLKQAGKSKGDKSEEHPLDEAIAQARAIMHDGGRNIGISRIRL